MSERCDGCTWLHSRMQTGIVDRRLNVMVPITVIYTCGFSEKYVGDENISSGVKNGHCWTTTRDDCNRWIGPDTLDEDIVKMCTDNG